MPVARLAYQLHLVPNVFHRIGRVVGREPKIERGPMQPGDVQRTWADLTRSGAELGFRPAVELEAGLAAEYRWLTEVL